MIKPSGHVHPASLVPHLQVAARIKQFKRGDRLVLSDATLADAISSVRPLDHNEYTALLNSPLTLRRLQVLAAGIKAESDVAGEFILLAAAGDEASHSLLSSNGCWQVNFLHGEQEWWIVLQALGEPDGDDDAQWELLGSDSTVWLRGALNENGELSGPWRGIEAPIDTLKRIGGRFQVRRCG